MDLENIQLSLATMEPAPIVVQHILSMEEAKTLLCLVWRGICGMLATKQIQVNTCCQQRNHLQGQQYQLWVKEQEP